MLHSANQLARVCEVAPCTRVVGVSPAGRRVEVMVMDDAAKLSGYRVMATARLAQQVADELGWMLPTPKVCDLVAEQAVVKIPPQPRPISMTEAAARKHSADVDAAYKSSRGLMDNAGKWWVVCNALATRPDRAANYGWFVDADPWRGIRSHAAVWSKRRVIQPLGLAHNAAHYDYSQTLRLMRRTMWVDGVEVDAAEVFGDEDLAQAVNHDGRLLVMRQPGVGVSATARTLPAPAPVPTPAPMPVARPTGGDFGDIPFRQAKNYTVASRRPGDVKWIVLHTAEIAEVPDAAERLAAWASGPSAPRASWHFAVDCDSVVQSVRLKDVAWHAPGANRYGIGIEQAGRASQGSAGWSDAYSVAMLDRTIRLVARLAQWGGIPLERRGPADLVAGVPGVCGHHDVTLAFKKSTHTDPGASYPWEAVLEAARRELAKL